MTPRDQVRLSKFISLVLRHQPDEAGLTLDAAGWVSVDDLLAGLARKGFVATRADLERVVAESDKQRFAFSPDGLRIRANQGHSVEVELGYEPCEPPEFLYHGTADRFLDSIRKQGLIKQARHHVHLSLDYETAVKVGQRHGRPVVLQIAAGRMRAAGHEFFRSANGVWLTESVPPEYLTEAPPK